MNEEKITALEKKIQKEHGNIAVSYTHLGTDTETIPVGRECHGGKTREGSRNSVK